LSRQQYSEEAAVDLASGKGGLIAQEENVKRIAILSPGSREKAKIVREYHPFGHHLGELDPPGLFIQLVFVSTAARSLDDHLHYL
jgi:hypothetical protein